MSEHLPNDINEDLVAPVRGRLLASMIRAILGNRWVTGWGLRGEQGSNGGVISLDPNVLPRYTKPYFWGKVTNNAASREDSETEQYQLEDQDHTVREVDANGTVIPDVDGGRFTRKARAHNERKNVPIGTYLAVFKYPPKDTDDVWDYKFYIPDGLTDSPVNYASDSWDEGTGVSLDISTDEDEPREDETWDVEAQSLGRDGVQYSVARAFVENNNFSVFTCPVATDSSGFTIGVGSETMYRISGDEVATTFEGHIQVAAFPAALDNEVKPMLGPPLDDLRTLILEGDGASIEIEENGAVVSQVEIEFDETGRALIANDAGDKTVTIKAIAGGGADGNGYEFVDHNGVNVGTEPDNGRIDFKDSAASPTAGSQEVNWTITNDAANDTVDVEGEVDIDAWLKALGTYDDEKKQVLVNDNGTIKWVDTAECP